VKFSSPGKPVNGTRFLFLIRVLVKPYGRHIITSPAVLPFMRKLSAESYSFDGVGAQTIFTPGLAFSYIGIKVSFQNFESSARHDSIVSVIGAA
jgi:hypothetical protein